MSILVIINNQANCPSAGYGVGLRLQNSSISGGNENNKWAGIAAIAGGSSGYSNDTDLAFYVGCFILASNATCPPVEKMRIQSSTGYVGIGTTSPSAQLQICSSDGQLKLSGDGRAQMILGTSVRSWQFETSCGAGNVPGCGIGLVEAGYGTRFQISPGGVACFQNTVCMPMLLASGCIGIGTTTPTDQLSINNGTSNSYATLRLAGSNRGGQINFYNQQYPTAQILVDQSGNVEVSTGVFGGASVTSKLLIANTGQACFACCITAPALKINSPTYIPLAINSSYGQVGLEFQLGGTGFASIGSASNVTGAYTGSETDLGLGTNASATANIIFATGAGSTRRMTITCTGNVGIATPSPAYKLDVSGATRVGSLLVSNTTTTTWCVGRIDDARANTWYTIYTWPSIYDGAFTLAQLGYEDNNGDGANAHAFWMTVGAAYSTGFSTSQIGGATNLCLQRSGQSLQALITGVTDRTSGAYLGYTLQTMIVAS